MSAFPQRKHVRLKNYDYSQNGVYFVTICTKDRKPLLSTIPVGRGALTPPQDALTTTTPVGRGALTPPQDALTTTTPVGRGALTPPQDALATTIPVGRGALTPPEIHLSQIGEISDRYILNMNTAYGCVYVDHYVIMPNHIHLLLRIDSAPASSGGMRASRPTLQTIVRSFKTMVTRQIGTSVWQDSFYEHIVRSEASYLEIWKYIDENPIKWQEDKYYAP